MEIYNILIKQQIMDSPAMETECEGIQIAHPTFETDRTDPKMLLNEVRYHRVPGEGLLFALLAEVELDRTF